MLLPNRSIIAISGEDRVSFLQGLITNDIANLEEGRAVYACLLTAQGRFLHDFFIAADGERLLIDCEADRRADLLQRLESFRLRSKIQIVDETKDWHVLAHHGEDWSGHLTDCLLFDDPRDSRLGKRIIHLVGPTRPPRDHEAWQTYEQIRISLAVPDGSRDMTPGQALLLENNIDRLNGIAWNKGCYIGQELTARMHHRGGVKKRLTTVRIEGEAPAVGTPVMTGQREMGEMRSSCGDTGLALLRLEAAVELSCGEAKLFV